MPVLALISQRNGKLTLGDLPKISELTGHAEGEIIVILTLDEALEYLKLKKEGGKE